MFSNFLTTGPGIAAAVLSLCVAQTSYGENLTIESLPSRIGLDGQLEALAVAGIVVNHGVTEDDLTAFESRGDLEQGPYVGLVEVLGGELEREPYTSLADSLWMCDFERIEGHGAYREVIERLERMTGSVLGLSEITDFVDLESNTAWVEFNLNGTKVRWDAVVDGDWLDPYILVKYDALLKANSAAVRIYLNHGDYGQVAFLAAFTKQQLDAFRRLSPLRFELIDM